MTEFDQYEALLFDCDGTLADTMPGHWQAWQKFGENTGVVLSETQFYELAGVPTYDIINQLTHYKLPHEELVRMSDLKEHHYLSDLSHVKPIAKVYEVVKAYQNKKPMGIVTGGTRDVVTKTLQALKMMDVFDTVVSANDVEHPKPAPDTFLLAASHLNVDPKNCIVFEDADPGLLGAKAAGMDTIDVRVWKTNL